MEEVIKQAPEGIDIKIIKEIFEKNNENTTKTLMELWNITEKKEREISKVQQKWNEVRETCDAFDTEMSNFLKEAKKNAVKL